MKRGHRLALVGIALASGVVLVGLLTSLGSASQGPISGVLTRLGTAFGSLEMSLRERLGGPGRSADLDWFAPYRTDTARLKNPDVVLLGAYDSLVPDTLEGVVDLERALGTTLPLVHGYTAWGDKPDQQFPLRLATAIWSMGSVPMITWEPWLTDFENSLHPHLPLRDARDRNGLGAVARGDYDFYVDAWAAEAAAFGKPLFLRVGHEMNDPYRYPWGPQNNTKEEFIAAWRHIVERFREAGAHNVIWIWAPHVAYEYWELYYPGSEYVDWVSTGTLNFGTVANWSLWWTFYELFGMKYAALASFGKPVMIDEFGSLAVGGDRAEWYRGALSGLPEKYPGVRALLFFNAREDQTLTYQKADWSIAGDDALAETVASAIRSWAPADHAR
jgi:hypothetical protein